MKRLILILALILTATAFADDVTISDGNIGLGVSEPQARLDLAPSSLPGGGLKLGDVELYRDGPNSWITPDKLTAAYFEANGNDNILLRFKGNNAITRDSDDNLNYGEGGLFKGALFWAGPVLSLSYDADGVVAMHRNQGADPPATCDPFSLWLDTDTSVDDNCTTDSDGAICACLEDDVWTVIFEP